MCDFAPVFRVIKLMICNSNNQGLRDLRRVLLSLTVAGVAFLLNPLMPQGRQLPADEPSFQTPPAEETLAEDSNETDHSHRHDPIVVRSKPVIERLPVSVIDPVDVTVSRAGSIYVADAKAQTVFRIASDGLVDTPLRDATGLTRLCLDQDNHLYVLLRESRNSRVLQITPNGLSVELASIPFEATSMARLASGEILLASRTSQELIMISTDATHQVLATLPETIIDVAVSSSEQIHVLHGSGLVSYVSLDGNATASGKVPADCRRLFSLPEGEMAALSTSTGSKGEIILIERPVDDQSANKPASDQSKASVEDSVISPRVYSTVPSGTQAVAFDDLGNMSLVNPELRAVTRVTTTLMIPCPHCGRPTRLILSPNGPAAPRGRSF